MNWLELNAVRIKNFLQDSDFYANPLSEALGIKYPVKTIAELEDAYVKVQNFVRSKKNDFEQREIISFAFSLLTAQYLINIGKYSYEMVKRRTNEGLFYQGFYYEIILSKADGIIQKNSIINSVMRVLHSRGKFDFREFYWHITGIPTQDQI